jgi:hypothetical protein
MIDDIVERAVIKAGCAKTLADHLDISPSELSRVRAGETGLKLNKIDKLIEFTGHRLVPSDHESKMRETIKTLAYLFQEADERNGRMK